MSKIGEYTATHAMVTVPKGEGRVYEICDHTGEVIGTGQFPDGPEFQVEIPRGGSLDVQFPGGHTFTHISKDSPDEIRKAAQTSVPGLRVGV